MGADLNGTPARPSTPATKSSLGARAKLTLVEISAGTGAYLHNPVMDIRFGRTRPASPISACKRESRRIRIHLSAVYARIGGGMHPMTDLP